MSNSSLVNYTKLSPNYSNRTSKICKITPHHMGGRLSVETCGSVFSSSAREASSNYGIGYDGRVALYVDEANRAWTSSSWANDNQAVTIEVSNSSIGGNWPVSDDVYEKLIQLCADICKRNGMKELVWTGTPSGSLTCHYMFAPTGCPGPFLKDRMSLLAQEVTRRLKTGQQQTSQTVMIKDGDDLKEVYIPKGGADVYRLYNSNGLHMYTTSANERDTLVKNGWKNEGVAWKSPDTGLVVYRMYNANNGEHMFTTSFNEAAKMQASGWKYEGVNFASARSGKPVYRLYNPNAGLHFFTADKSEHDSLVKAGWKSEGTAFYAV